jgi:hypothetical protein
MCRIPRLVCVAATLVLTIAPADEASARRGRCRRAHCCAKQSSCCKPYGDNYYCLQYKIYEVGEDQYLYHTYLYEGDCDAELQEIPSIESDHGDYPYHICENDDECIKRSGYTHGNHVFLGFEKPLPPDFPRGWEGNPDIDQLEERFERLRFEEEGRTYKARVFRLHLKKSGKKIFVAFEIGHFPAGVDPRPISFNKWQVKRASGLHSYRVKYEGTKMLFLVDREG